jgi:hypothetical protein
LICTTSASTGTIRAAAGTGGDGALGGILLGNAAMNGKGGGSLTGTTGQVGVAGKTVFIRI